MRQQGIYSKSPGYNQGRETQYRQPRGPGLPSSTEGDAVGPEQNYQGAETVARALTQTFPT
jgi:hypothetical protein